MENNMSSWEVCKEGYVIVDISTPKHPDAKMKLDRATRFWLAGMGITQFTPHQATCNRKPCAVFRYKNTLYKLHRFILNNPEGLIDHINHDPLDNRLSNLRVCSASVNLFNKEPSKVNKSGIIGVHFDKSRQKWMAYITKDLKRKHLGRFATKEEAIEARRAGELKYFGETLEYEE